jgi:RNA polymerase sigma-70 factor (ECF subfamily)
LDPLPLSDETLWRDQAGRGDAAALGQIYDAYATRIFKYLYRRLGSVPLAEDLTADVFVRLVETSGTPHFCRGSLAPWLYRLAHNRLVDHYRRHRESALPDDADFAADEVEAVGVHRGELRVALTRLTSDQQQVIVLKFVEGLSNSEIAAALDKPEGAVKSLQHRALASLRRLLGDGEA